MTRVAPLVAVIFSSLLRWASTEDSILCTWTKLLPDGEVHYTFLRHGSSSLRLYHSVWSGQRALRSCAWSDDAAVIRDYFSLCRERAQEFSDHPDGNLNFILEGEDVCVSAASPGLVRGERTGKRPARSVGWLPAGQDEGSEVKTHQRVKRGFIVPGTLWCGSGNKAPSYEDLGVFADTDSCCREHDQCKHTILSFHSEFGVFNSNIFTMSHCDCDNKFHSCLMEANDSISHVVGYTFFNLLKMHCFEFSHRLQCTQRNWFGMCKETKMALYAEVYPPTLFENSSPTEASMNISSSTNNTGTAAELQSSTSDPQLFSITSSPSAFITPPTGTNTSTAGRATGPAAGATDPLQNTLPTKTRSLTDLDPDISERRRSCEIYKDLDQCQNKILPQQDRYGLHNPESRILYHCNCTTRLFQTLAKQRRLTEVQALLLGHVSQSCFLHQDCTAGGSCTAVLVKAEFPRVAEVEQQRHLQAERLKVRRPNSSRAKRKDQAARLHKLCLRVTQRKMNKSRRRGQNAHRPAAPELV